MLRLIIQTKRTYKKIEKQVIELTEERGIVDMTENCSTEDESGVGLSTKSKYDVDSEVPLDEDSYKELDTIVIEDEDWIEYIQRSTVDTLDKMEHAKIRCWNRTHKKMKWKLALRIATSLIERWLKKAAEWNPELSSRYRTNRAIGRPLLGRTLVIHRVDAVVVVIKAKTTGRTRTNQGPETHGVTGSRGSSRNFVDVT